MRTLFLFLTLLSCEAFGQVKSKYSFNLDCFATKDTISAEALTKLKEITIWEDGKPSLDAWIKSYELSVWTKGAYNTFKGYNNCATLPDDLIVKLIKSDKFIFESILVYVKGGKEIVTQKIPEATFYRSEKVYRRCK